MTSTHFSDELVTLYHGDCVEVMRELPDESAHAVVTDPPYGIGFMGHEWDQPGEFGPLRKNGRPGVMGREAKFDHTTGSARDGAMEAGRYDQSLGANQRFALWVEAWASECIRVLKPGGYMLVSGSPRTWHRLASGIEDAGFEIRDSIAWLYGSGFPKSMDVSKAIDKAAGAQREVVGRTKTNVGMQGGNFANKSAAGFVDITAPATEEAKRWDGWGTALKPAFEPIVVARKPMPGTVAENISAHGTGGLNIAATRVDFIDGDDRAETVNKNRHATFGTEPGQNKVYGDFSQTPMKDYHGNDGRWPTNVVIDQSQAAAIGREARFFPTFRYEAKAPAAERPESGGVQHPTVKPLDLMRWLVRLVTPPDGVVLEPFAGSGTTVEAALLEGFRCIAVEREEKYLPLIMQRISKPLQQSLFDDLAVGDE